MNLSMEGGNIGNAYATWVYLADVSPGRYGHLNSPGPVRAPRFGLIPVRQRDLEDPACLPSSSYFNMAKIEYLFASFFQVVVDTWHHAVGNAALGAGLQEVVMRAFWGIASTPMQFGGNFGVGVLSNLYYSFQMNTRFDQQAIAAYLGCR